MATDWEFCDFLDTCGKWFTPAFPEELSICECSEIEHDVLLGWQF